MNDYIDRQKLLKDIEQYHLSDGKFQYWVEVQQSADVQPVRHGHWIGYAGTIGNECSICHTWLDVMQGTAEMNFCPNCGAKMDGEQND